LNSVSKQIKTHFQFIRAKKTKRLPVVLTKGEVQQVLGQLTGLAQLVGQLLYGSGLRIDETVRLRVQNIDFERRQLLVRDGKGAQDRITMLPETIDEPLKNHLHRVEDLHQADLQEGYGRVYLPNALERKFPNAEREWVWQYVFPSKRISNSWGDGIMRRHHNSPSTIQKAIRDASTSQKWGNMSRHIPFGIVLPPISLKRATIFALFKSCWGIKTSKQP
jgi:integrase